jgi:CPA2 family monovalent cation:H+ antiporter-2
VSFALGAFFAGMVLRESDLSHRAAEESLPLRDAFSVLFFVSVGMLFEPKVLIEQPFHVLVTVAIIVLGKALASAILVVAFRYPVRTALTVSASLAQIGEFSFILVGLGMTLGLLPKEGQSLVLAGALISIAINPLVFGVVDPVRAWVSRRPSWSRVLDPVANPLSALPLSTDARYLSRQVVLVGWGRVGKRIARSLREREVPLVVAEENREAVERLRADGIAAVWGDATEPDVLIQAHIKDARALVIATPQTIQVRRMVETARLLNPSIEIVVRSHNAEEALLLERDGTGRVFVGEAELASAMTRHVLELVQPPPTSH